MAVKNAIYQVDNGSGFDEIHFKTKASMVQCNNGKDIETNLSEVVSRESNSQGTWIRFSDGTQICYKMATVNLATGTAWNAFYIGSVGLGALPASFATTPTITAQFQNPENSFFLMHVTASSASSWGNLWGMRPFSQPNAIATTVALIAIGKWK